MSTLALLRDYAGCRAVLHDARIELADGTRTAEEVSRLERVLSEAEDAIWEGGETAHRGISWHRRIKAPRLDEFAFWDDLDEDEAAGLSALPEKFVDARRDGWRAERRRDTGQIWAEIQWLEWQGQPLTTRVSGTFFGVDRGVAPDNLGNTFAFAVDRQTFYERVTFDAEQRPQHVYMSPANYQRLQDRLDSVAQGLSQVPQADLRQALDVSMAQAWTPGARASDVQDRVVSGAALYLGMRYMWPEGAMTMLRQVHEHAVNRCERHMSLGSWLPRSDRSPGDLFDDGREWSRSLTARADDRVDALAYAMNATRDDGIEARVTSYVHLTRPGFNGVFHMPEDTEDE